MHIIHITSEMALIAKVGGLGDVILGLSRQCQEDGHTVEVILPKYASIQYSLIRDLHILHRDLWVFGSGKWQHNSVWSGWVEGIRVYFIEPHTAPHYFNREKIYGYPDDIERFVYFSKAALEFMLLAKIKPDVLHLHEWHVGLVAPLVKEHFLSLEESRPGIMFTIHNLEHQGRCSPVELERIGLASDLFPLMRDEGNPNVLNLLKGGIEYCDHLTTVSPTYAREILTPLGAKGLDQTLKAHAHKLTGILNGLDYALWGPSIDPFLPTPYSHDPKSWEGKKRCKQELQMRFSLTQQSNRPLVGFVGRLVPQKGIDLVKHALFKILEAGGQFILLGSAASSEVDEDFHTLKIHFGDNPNIHLELHHNEELVHLIYAGSDMLLVPSRFEPCGLTQLIALHYGSVPIARHTGGLADTIFEGENGFVFHDSSFEGVESAVKRALETYLNHPDQWQKLMAHGMRQDFSWRSSAAKYEEIYRSVKERTATALGLSLSS